MRTIYQNATRVLVWLGKDECGLGARGIKAMQEIARQCSLQETPEPWPEKTKMKDVQELWDLLPKHMLQDPCLDTPENWTALSWFFSRSWFSRLWIIQEVNVNKEVQMLCGSTQVSWDVAVLAASYIKQHSRIHRRWGFPASHFNNAYYMRRRFWLQKVALPSLLNWGRSFNASDPMDRVYALMGMPSFNQIRHLLTVDYSKPKVDLYTDIATICICEMGGLRILCYAQHLEEGSEFPSWVPQWDRPERYRAIQDSLTKVRWNPSGGRELEASVDPRLRCLKSKGIIFDTIKSVCPLGKTMSLLDESSDHPVISFWEAQNRKPTTYPTGEGSLDVLASVIATGLDKNLRKASANIDSFKQDFAAYLNRLLCISGRDQHAYRQIAKAEEQGDWFGYESLVQSTCQYRSLVFTEMGYMGLGPNCQVGDLVCILFGGEVPFVLRPSEGYYRLVGDVYIHGIMEGEAMGLHGNEKSPAMIFDIR
jgi:hypothetical protein